MVFQFLIGTSLLLSHFTHILNSSFPVLGNAGFLFLLHLLAETLLSVNKHVGILTGATKLALEFTGEDGHHTGVIEIVPVLNNSPFRIRNGEVALVIIILNLHFFLLILLWLLLLLLIFLVVFLVVLFILLFVLLVSLALLLLFPSLRLLFLSLWLLFLSRGEFFLDLCLFLLSWLFLQSQWFFIILGIFLFLDLVLSHEFLRIVFHFLYRHWF